MAGINNKYSNCYINSVLQLLTTEFEIIDKSGNKNLINFLEMYLNYENIDCDILIKYYATIDKNYVLNIQGDSSECLNYFLNNINDDLFRIELEQEVIQVNADENNEPIKSKETSKTSKIEKNLFLPICDTIQESIDYYLKDVDTEKNIINDKISYSPIIKIKITNNPKYLFISLTRFSPIDFTKNNKEVKITNITVNNCKYTCTSFIVHTGDINFGHYYNVKLIGDKWYLYDDMSVLKINDEDLEYLKKIAYIFLYKKIDNC